MNGTDERPQKVWLTATAGEVERELQIDFAPESRIADLCASLAEEIAPGVETTWVLRSERLGRDLSQDAPIAESGLVTGDRVELLSEARVEADRGGAPGAVDLVVVGGPLLGARYRLEMGQHLVGRGSGSDVKLEDPSMSRRHFEVTVSENGVSVRDAGSTNGTFLDGERFEGSRSLGPKDVLEAGGSLIGFEPALSLTSASSSSGVEIPFNRPPRVRPAQRELELDIPAPPEDPTGPRIPLAMSIVPLIVGIAMVMLFPENKAMFLFFAMTPVIAVWSFLEERRSGAKSFRARRDDFLAEVEARESQVAAFVEEEVAVRRDAFPDVAELTSRVRGLSPRLWERRPTDTDFLAIRVGWGDEPSRSRVAQPSSGSRSLRDEAAQRFSRYATLRAVPVVVDLRVAGTTGLCGDPDDVAALARWAIVQLASLHSPDELEMAALLSSDATTGWDWLKWFPHFGAITDDPRVAFGADGLHLVERLDPAVPERASEPHTLIVIDGDVELPRSALGRLLRTTPESRTSVLWLGRDPNALPGECKAVVEVDAGADKLTVLHPNTGERSHHPSPEGVSIDHAAAIGRALAPVRDTSVGTTRRSVPARVSLFDTLEITDPSVRDIRERWRSPTTERSAGVGFSDEGPFNIDLRRDGPHALIGGTTGAGKSELLQSMIASLAFRYSPERVNLLLIDYKGGTAFQPLEGLPHVVGSVTDLDAHLARRALASLDAELKRRERTLAEHGARDVVALGGKGIETVPDLVLVIDEFAALVGELPGFVDGLVDIAQRGRALGLHLILATQKPAGVVSDKIRANTNLRIALRMSDEPDSFDVIGLPDAAHIPRTTPGRGFVRTGHGEITEVQSASSSAPPLTARSAHLVLRPLGPAGLEGETSPSEPGGDTRTQLDVVVETIAAAAEGRPVPRSPVLSPLPEVLPLEELGAPSGGRRYPVGLLDEPSGQVQRPFELDLTKDGSVLIYGAGGSGKTTLLRTIAASIASHSDADRTHIYALDLGTRGLASLASLPHCGGVVFAEEDERIRRLFSMLRDEISERREHPQRHAPDIVVLLDGYAGFAAAFERVDFGEMVDALPRLVADGRQVGIHFAITADRRGAVPAALTGIVADRIVLRLADDDDYSAFGLSPGHDKEALAVRGRGFLGTGASIQCAVAGTGASMTEQIEAIERLATALPTTPAAPQVRTLPGSVTTSELPPPSDVRTPIIGVDERLDPASIDLRDGHFLVAGPRRSGRTTTLASIAAQVRDADPGAQIYVLSPRRTELDVPDATVIDGLDACETWIAGAEDALAGSRRATVLIDDGDELFEVPGADRLQRAMKMARDSDVRFVVAVETHATHRAYGGWIAELKKDKQGLLLEPELEVDGDILGVRLPRRKMRFPPGRGYLVWRGEARLIQVARRTSGSGSA